MGTFRTSSVSGGERYRGRHRFEHWYRDNTVYFVTSRTEKGVHAFRARETQDVFWYNLVKYAKEFGVALWVTTLMSNHYHMIFYLRFGENLGPFMQRLHGATAKQCNDLLPERITPFWCFKGRQTYFDGCLRDEVQVRRTYRYVLTQSTRAGLVSDWRDYPNTRVTIELEAGLARARERNTFLPRVAYPRYQRPR